MPGLTFTVGDTAPALAGTLNTVLTGASLEVHIQPPGGGEPIVHAGDVIDGPNGAWSMDWDVDDLSVRGWHTYEIQVTYSDGSVETYWSDQRGTALGFNVRAQIA